MQGGLIARYAIGKLYDPHARRVAGLRPAHYMSIAAPHLGCDGFSGPSQVRLVASGALTQAGWQEAALCLETADSCKPPMLAVASLRTLALARLSVVRWVAAPPWRQGTGQQ